MTFDSLEISIFFASCVALKLDLLLTFNQFQFRKMIITSATIEKE